MTTIASKPKPKTLADYKFAESTKASLIKLDKRIHQLGDSVQRKLNVYYVAYKVSENTRSNFVQVYDGDMFFELGLRIAFDNIDDPSKLCISARKKTWTLLRVYPDTNLDDVMYLVQQAYAANKGSQPNHAKVVPSPSELVPKVPAMSIDEKLQHIAEIVTDIYEMVDDLYAVYVFPQSQNASRMQGQSDESKRT